MRRVFRGFNDMMAFVLVHLHIFARRMMADRAQGLRHGRDRYHQDK